MPNYLGQNFLINKRIAEKVVEAANVNTNDIVLEAGPGKGILTELLVQKAKKVIAVEKDRKLADFLSDKFVHYKNLKIVHNDILKLKTAKIGDYKIVANIPYYITSRFLRQFLTAKCQPKLMALMVQKEVAERIVAKNGKESLLSISIKAYGQPEIIANVPAGNFFPKPKIDSAIILIDKISKNFFIKNKIDEKKFFQLVKLGFSHKRKLLKNNLQSSFTNFTRPGLVNVKLQRCEISTLARAEDLSLENWKCLLKTKDRPL